MTTLITSTGNITMQNDNNVDELKWNANYDGDIANIKLNITEHENIKTDKGFHLEEKGCSRSEHPFSDYTPSASSTEYGGLV